jgi:hypothetical protein
MLEFERRRSNSLPMRFSSTRTPLKTRCVCRPRSALCWTRGKIAFHSLSMIFLRMFQRAVFFSYCDLLCTGKFNLGTMGPCEYIRRREIITLCHYIHDTIVTIKLSIFNNIQLPDSNLVKVPDVVRYPSGKRSRHCGRRWSVMAALI